MNADLLAFTKDLRLNTKTVYKQDAKLAAAIDKLCCSQAKLFNASGLKLLPDRKIQFTEVQELLKGTVAKECKLFG